MDSREAEEALRRMNEAKGRLAARAHWSWPRHLAFGAVTGALVASYALAPAAQTIAAVLCIIAIVAIVARDRKRDGFFVNGYRRGRTRSVTLLLLLAIVVAIAAAILGKEHGWRWAPLAAGAVLFVVATVASLAWERVYRAELGGSA